MRVDKRFCAWLITAGLLVATLTLAACGPIGRPLGGPVGSGGSGGPLGGGTNTTATGGASTTGASGATATSGASGSTGATINLAALPLGDGKTGAVAVGYVDSCQTSFGGGGGAKGSGPWITGSTWNSTTKPAVQGSVSWPQASYSVTLSGNSRIIQSNDLPKGFTTGVFPIAATDPAYQYDRNPNHIAAQSINWTLPANPTAATTPSCVGMGPIGILDDGVVFFNALDAAGRDAVAHEVQDSCGGHPDQSSEYHYHEVSPCIMKTATGSSTLVGYALDGYGIYVERDANGNLLTNAGLDTCHGRTSVVTWDGKQVSMYHYDATAEYPYTVGCYHGTPINTH